jgi:hypothetical protein
MPPTTQMIMGFEIPNHNLTHFSSHQGQRLNRRKPAFLREKKINLKCRHNLNKKNPANEMNLMPTIVVFNLKCWKKICEFVCSLRHWIRDAWKPILGIPSKGF